MNHKDILTRAWKLLWNYKVLWVFGIILALTTSSGGDRMWQSSNNSRNGDNQSESTPSEGEFKEFFEDFEQNFEKEFSNVIPAEVSTAVITISILVGCVILFLIITSVILRYISETALIKLVDEYEITGEKRTWKEGFKIGWSRTAWKLFLIDLAIGVPIFLGFVLLLALIAAPNFLWMTDNMAAGIFGSAISMGLFVGLIFLVIIVAAGLSLLTHFFRRVCALEDFGVRASIRSGFQLVRRNIKDVGLMWLIMIGVNLGFGIALIPIVFLLVITAGIIGGLLGLTAGGLTSLFASGEVPIIVGAIVGSPIFLLILIAPLAFIGGLKETFVSNTWTLTYRELQILESLSPEIEAEYPEIEGDEEIPEADTNR
jgi:hypothetical protein